MDFMRDRLVRVFTVIDQRLENQPLLVSIRRGLIFMIPLVLLGSIALIFLSLPIPAYHEFMHATFGDQWKNVFNYVRDGTFSILSLIMVVCTSYSYAIEHGQRYQLKVSPIIASAVSLGSFVALSGISKAGFSISSFGPVGVFISIVVAVTSAILFMRLSSLELLQVRAFTSGANSTFGSAVTAIYPAAITISMFAILNQVLSGVFEVSDIHAFISGVASSMFSRINSPFVSGMLFVLLVHLLWFFGMHGSNVLEPVAQSIFVPALSANQVAIGAGSAPTEVFTKTFFDNFVLMGGCGAALCLILAIMLAGRHKNQRRLAKMSVIPVLCNISELMIFGIPIVLNPVYFLPFILTPVLLTLTSYLAVYYGLVPYTSNLVEWTTPILLSGYASTGSISGSLLQLFNLLLGTLCYIPFVGLAERVADARVKNNLGRVYALIGNAVEQVAATTLLARHDDIGDIARSLTVDLHHDLENDRVTLFYQPQVDHAGRLFGLEALLRWKHESYGYIHPPLVIALAEEAQLIDKLGYWVLDRACHDLKHLNELGMDCITVSVNISALQLENDNFIADLRDVIQKHRIEPQSLQVEITEQLALASSTRILNQIKSIKQLGVKLAMDDFGMGHSSLMYLKEYEFNTIKLDGSLVREILVNQNCCNIISSIVFLGKSLNYSVVAEYVERDEQRELLHELGCDRYQGYLFSKPLPYPQLVQCIQEGSLCISHGVKATRTQLLQ